MHTRGNEASEGFWYLPLYKYVDLAHAAAVESGSMKIGTLRGYGRIEGARCDPNEATVDRPIGELDTSLPHHREYLQAATGISFPERPIRISGPGSVFRTVATDHYCYCLSSTPLVTDPIGIPQAVFRIANPMGWLDAVHDLTRELGPFVCDQVRYGSREVSLENNPTARPDAFLKPLRFAWEREVRLVWRNSTSTELPSLPIFPGSSAVAQWIERIR